MSVDFVLIGTGLSPLISARELLQNGHSVLILNPMREFFLERSELPFDPLWPTENGKDLIRRIELSRPESVLEVLRPGYPGAVEESVWGASETSVKDWAAPHVRERKRLWIHEPSRMTNVRFDREWERIEQGFLEGIDRGVHFQELEGAAAVRRFPGFAKGRFDTARGYLVQRQCDVDVTRYLYGFLEFVLERMGEGNVLRNVTDWEWDGKNEVHFSRGGAVESITCGKLVVFWTPALSAALSSRVFGKIKTIPSELQEERPTTLWEEWVLISRDPLEPTVIGQLEDLWVWTDVEGAFENQRDQLYRLNVMRPGPVERGDFFDSLSQLTSEFLGWDKFSIRSMTERRLFTSSLTPNHFSIGAEIVTCCEGFLPHIVKGVRGLSKGWL